MTQTKALSNSSKVAIMMATYNGEKYLQEQINSILNQNYEDIHLIVRDDGSTDSTRSILHKYSDRITIIEGENIGCKACFLEVAKYASKHFDSYKYFAFSDQDDLWLEDKIQAAISRLEKIDQDTKPMLYICRPKLVDEKLQELDPLLLSKHKNERSFSYTLEEAFMLGTCAGCTMVFNRKLLDLFIKATSNVMYLHDDWIYKVCFACGGILVVDNDAHILYRQHGNNVLGGNQSLYAAWKRRFKTFKEGRVRSSKAQSILDIYSEDITEHAQKVLYDIANYSHSIKSKLRLLFSQRFRTHSIKFNILFIIAVIFNRY